MILKTGKKIISLIVIFLMCFSMFCFNAGCKKSNVIKLEVYSQLANFQGKQAGMLGTLLKDKFNVELNIISDEEGIYETRMESGFLGDIVVWGSNGKEYKEAINQGLLYDWEEDNLLDEYGPYIKEHMSAALEANREVNPDKKIHGFGHNVATSAEDHEAFFYTWDIRWDLYKQLGYPEVTDLDSYLQLLKAMKQICPTDDNGNPTYAVSLWPDWDGAMVMYVKAFASAYYGYDELALGLYDSQTGKFHGALEDNGPYLTSLKFFNKLYQEGLLDPDSSTQTYDQMCEVVSNGGTFFSIFDYAGSGQFNTDANIAKNRMMLPLVPSEATVVGYGMSLIGGNRIWSIGADTKYPELCMEIINWLCTPEGSMTIFHGLKGVIWDYDENRKTKFTDFGRTCTNDPTTLLNGQKWTSPYTNKTYTLSGSFNDGKLQINNTTWSMNATNPDTGERYNWKFWENEMGDPKCDIEADWREKTGCKSNDEYINKCNYSVVPAVNYSESVRSDELELKWQNVTTKLKEYSWKCIYAKNDGEFSYLVKEMKKVCNGYGYADVLAWSEGEAAIKWALQQEAAK